MRPLLHNPFPRLWFLQSKLDLTWCITLYNIPVQAKDNSFSCNREYKRHETLPSQITKE